LAWAADCRDGESAVWEWGWDGDGWGRTPWRRESRDERESFECESFVSAEFEPYESVVVDFLFFRWENGREFGD